MNSMWDSGIHRSASLRTQSGLEPASSVIIGKFSECTKFESTKIVLEAGCGWLTLSILKFMLNGDKVSSFDGWSHSDDKLLCDDLVIKKQLAHFCEH